MNGSKKESSGSSTGLASVISDAHSIIAAAEQRAQEIVAEAQRQLEHSREAGYREGYEQGLNEASKKAVRLIEESTKVADSLAEEGAKLAMAIAGTIIGEHIKLHPEAAKLIAMRALQESVVGDSITLLVNPEDAAIMEKSLTQLRRIAGNAVISLETEPSISRGGCMVRSDFGEVDATIENLLQTVRDRLGLAANE